MSLSLRPYQSDAIASTREAMRKHKRVMLQLPTGGGKTAIASAIMSTATGRGKVVFFVCHRRELVAQTSNSLRRYGIAHSFVAAGRPFDGAARLFVCSIDTLRARKLDIVPDLVVWDEAHHTAAGTWAQLMQRYGQAYHVGLSATPCRSDGSGLAECYDEMVVGPSVAWLIEEGFLSRYRVFAPSAPDVSGVNVGAAGDYSVRALETAVTKAGLTGDAVAHYKKHAAGLQAVAFCVSVAHSLAVAKEFNARGVPAAHIDGGMHAQERDDIVRRFAEGAIKVLTSVAIISEGFDLANVSGIDSATIDCVLLLRPTKSLALYMQQVGRCLRPAPGKTAIILDHAGCTATHGFVDDERVWSLTAAAAKRDTGEAAPPAPATCVECFNQLRRPAPPLCPYCGGQVSIPKPLPKHSKAELREITRLAREAEQAEKAAAKAAEKLAKEAAKEAERAAKAEAAVVRRQEERACRSFDDLLKLARGRGYEHPAHWARKQAVMRRLHL